MNPGSLQQPKGAALLGEHAIKRRKIYKKKKKDRKKGRDFRKYLQYLPTTSSKLLPTPISLLVLLYVYRLFFFFFLYFVYSCTMTKHRLKIGQSLFLVHYSIFFGILVFLVELKFFFFSVGMRDFGDF